MGQCVCVCVHAPGSANDKQAGMRLRHGRDHHVLAGADVRGAMRICAESVTGRSAGGRWNKTQLLLPEIMTHNQSGTEFVFKRGAGSGHL